MCIQCIPLLSPKNVPLFLISWNNPENPQIWFHMIGPLFPQKTHVYAKQPIVFLFIPIGSMCGIFTYIWLIFMVHVGEYTTHGSYGIQNYTSTASNLHPGSWPSNVSWGSTQLQPECLLGFGFSWKWQVGMPGYLWNDGGVVEVVCLRVWREWKISGWWFQIFFISTLTWGDDPFGRAYFSNGLVQPPTRYERLHFCVVPFWRYDLVFCMFWMPWRVFCLGSFFLKWDNPGGWMESWEGWISS